MRFRIKPVTAWGYDIFISLYSLYLLRALGDLKSYILYYLLRIEFEMFKWSH